MNSNRPIHTKGNLYRLTLVLLMVLSIFSVSGSIGLSSYQPQKPTTELLLTAGQKSISCSGYYCSLKRNHKVATEYQLQKQQKYAVIRFNELFTIQFIHQSYKFLEIKPAIRHNHSSIRVTRLQYKPLPA